MDTYTAASLLPWRYRLMLGWVLRSGVWIGRWWLWSLRFHQRVIPKDTPGRENDLTTNAELYAQRAMILWFRFWLPGFGVVAEEGLLFRPGRARFVSKYGDWRVAIDSGDGSKMYAESEFARVSTLAALLRMLSDGEPDQTVYAAYAAGLADRFMYGYTPWNALKAYTRRWRLTWRVPLQPAVKSREKRSRSLMGHWCVSRQLPGAYDNALIDALVETSGRGGPFSKVLVGTGSPTVALMTLLRGSAAVMVFEAHPIGLWDEAVLVGLVKAGGLVYLRVVDGGAAFVEYEPKLQTETYQRKHPVLVLHKRYLAELHQWAWLRHERLAES